jgi:hypothetical protein
LYVFPALRGQLEQCLADVGYPYRKEEDLQALEKKEDYK